MLKNFFHSNMNNIWFVRNSYRRYIYIAIFILLVNCSIAIYLYYSLLSVGKIPLFATTTDGRILSIDYNS